VSGIGREFISKLVNEKRILNKPEEERDPGKGTCLAGTSKVIPDTGVHYACYTDGKPGRKWGCIP